MAVTKRQSYLRTLISSTTPRRPFLTHLSADNSWLLSVPIPSGDPKYRQGKKYFHVLLDAWLTPSNTPIASAPWFQVQSHIETPACQSIADVLDLIADIEIAAGSNGDIKAQIDAAVAGHRAADHMNPETLKQVDPSVPLFAVASAMTTARSWKHFENVVQIPDFSRDGESIDWRTASSTEAPHLPPWLAVWRIPPRSESPGLHWGICIVFDVDGREQAECVIQVPHGLDIDDAALVKKASPSIKTLALLHTTKESFFYGWGVANMGAGHGIQVAKAVGAKYCKFLFYTLSYPSWLQFLRCSHLQWRWELATNVYLIEV